MRDRHTADGQRHKEKSHGIEKKASEKREREREREGEEEREERTKEQGPVLVGATATLTWSV